MSRCWRSSGRPSLPRTWPCTSTTTTSWRSCCPRRRWTWTTTHTGQAMTRGPGGGVGFRSRAGHAALPWEKWRRHTLKAQLLLPVAKMRLCSPSGIVWLVSWWQHVTCVQLPRNGKLHDSQPTTSMLSSGLRYCENLRKITHMCF